jgi:general secretion pathway protein A
MSYQQYYGFIKEPFAQDIKLNDLYPLPGLQGLKDRFNYSIKLKAVSIITGEIGSGKSTSLRCASSQLHPSEYKIFALVANNGTLVEFLKLCSASLGEEIFTNSITRLLKGFRALVCEIASRKQTPILIIDESHLLRNDILAQLHVISQFEFDSKPMIPIILCGQNQLIDKLQSLPARAFASRIVGRSHLQSLTRKDMDGYLNHHLEIAGIKERIFCEESILAIHQGSGGLLRRANILARGALIAASKDNSRSVSADHVRLASSELI